MKRTIFAALAMSGILSVMPARAQSQEIIDDIHCFLVSSMMTQMDDPSIQNAGTISAMYWMGRLDGRAPQADLKALVLAEAPKIKGTLVSTELQRCGALLRVRGTQITEIGLAIEAQEKAAAPAAPQ